MARNRASFAPGVKPVAGFKPGKSGNPGGRPKAVKEVEALAREHTITAINTLVRLATSAKSEPAQASAAQALLDRGWGRPKQAVEHSGSIALSHEEALEALDQNDEPEGEGDPDEAPE